MKGRIDSVLRKYRLLPAVGGFAGVDAGLPGGLCRVSESGRDHHERGVGPVRPGPAASVASGGVSSCVFQHPISDDEIARKAEPHVPSSRKRFEAMATLANAGISTVILLSPIIPGLNDEDVPDLLARAKHAGAVEAMATLLRLSGPVEQVFME